MQVFQDQLQYCTSVLLPEMLRLNHSGLKMAYLENIIVR